MKLLLTAPGPSAVGRVACRRWDFGAGLCTGNAERGEGVGQIEPSDSMWASPVVLVTKKDGSARFCVDYRRLNATTVKDAYLLPQIDYSLRLLGRQQWFSTMHLASGYWEVAMSPDASRKPTSVTHVALRSLQCASDVRAAN